MIGHMVKFIKQFLQQFIPKSWYQSLNMIGISTSRISQNLSCLQKLQPTHTLIPVIKSNAYGHGIKQMCNIFNTIKNINIPLIAVDSYPEYQIVADTTDKEILVLWETLSKNYSLYNHRRTHLAVWTLVVLKKLVETKKPRKIHLFVNTGMNREGFQEEELSIALNFLEENKHNLNIIGVMSHLANADMIDNSFTEQQVLRFKEFYNQITWRWHKPLYTHISNSAGISKIKDSLFTASRTWLAMYGYNPLKTWDPHYDNYTSLQPALHITSTITAIQQLKKWDWISYGLSWKTPKETTTATLPFWYNEWLPRSAGEWFEVYYNNTPLPIRGKVCMNLSCCEIWDKKIHIGDTIEIIWRDDKKNNTIWQLSQTTQTIPYTILTWLDNWLKRVIVE